MSKTLNISTSIIVEKDLIEKQKYKIVDVEEFESPKEKQKGIKVKCASLNTEDKSKYSCILWKREQVGVNSKLGAFIVALSEIDNEGVPIQTDLKKWIGRTFLVVSWKEKQREISAID